MLDVSVVITCYNHEEFIGRCIRSVINQLHIEKKSYEIIVVDDFSSDNSKKIINDFDNHIIKIFNKKNKGLPYSRNLGIKKSLGKYLLFLDSDDYLSNDAIYIMKKFLDENKNNYDAVSCDYTTVKKNKTKIKRFSSKKKPIACGILYKKSKIVSSGMFNSKFKFYEDVEFRNRFLKKNKIGYLEIPLYRYTMHKNNSTKNKTILKKYHKMLEDLK